MSKSQNLKFRIPSSAPIINRKSESVQKYNVPCIPRRCESSREKLSSSSSGSKRSGRPDSSESDINVERMRKKKHKSVSQVTMEAEKSKVSLDSVVSKTVKLTGRSFKFKFKRVREVESVSGKETSNVDGGRSTILLSNLKNVESTTEECFAKEEHYEDQENIPLQQKLTLEDTSAEIVKIVKEIEEKCEKRMKKLIREQKSKVQEFHRIWEDNISKLEKYHKLEVAIIRSIHGNHTTTIDKLKILEDKFAKKMAENNLQKDKQLEDLEAEQLAARNEEIQKAANWLSEAKACISSKLTGYCKEQSFSSQHEEVSRCSESRTHILGAKDAMPLTEQHGQNSDSSRSVKGNHVVRSKNSDCATAEKVACNSSNGNPSSATDSSQKNEGRISFSDIRIPAVVEKIKQPKHLGAGGSILANLPASGERVHGEMQALDLHGEVPSEMPVKVANEIVDEEAIDLPDAEQLTQLKHFGCAERIFAKPPASGERVLGDMQSPELCKDIPAELAETDDKTVDNVSPVELYANTSSKGFGEGAIDLPDALLNQRNETDRTTIDDLDLAGKVLKTSEQTKASKHPYPLLPPRVREDQDVVSSDIQGHGVQVVGKVNSSPSGIVAAELFDTARESRSNIEPQAREEPAIETQSSSKAEASTTKIIDTVIAEQCSIQLQDQDTSVKDQVTLLIEAADSERVDTAAPVAASELVGTAKMELYNKLQDQAEPAIETQSMSMIEVSASEDLNNTSHMLSSIEQQDEDALIITDQVNLETEVSDSVLADNATPVQSHTDAPPIESDEQLQLMLIDASPSCNQLPSPELESRNHNLGRNSSGASETEMLSHESMSRLREDLELQSNILDVRHESQPSLTTSVQISASVQNNVATETELSTNVISHDAVLQLGGVTHLPSNQVSPSLFANPLQNELQKIEKETEELQKSCDEMIEGLKSECKKEIQELVDEVRKKYQLKFQDAKAHFTLKNNGLCQKEKKILMNKLLADAFNFNCLNTWSTWPLMQQGFPSSSMQYHQHFVRPAGATTPNPQIASPIGQAVQQISVPNSTRVGPITSQHFAAPSVQPAPHFEALSRLWAITGVHPTSLPHFGGNIYSSAQQFQSSIPAVAPSMPNATFISTFRNLQQQQQPLAAPQWPSNSHNPQLLGYLPAVMCTSVSSLDSLMDVEHQHRHHQLPGALRGNQSSCTGASTAICLSDED